MPLIANTQEPQRCAWPDGTYVQGGRPFTYESRSTGERKRRQAFVEAFPRNPDTMIRVDADTLEEAEAVAFAQYQRYVACGVHDFEPRGYRNGAGFCKRCGMFAGEQFTAEDLGIICSVCGVHALGWSMGGADFCEEHYPRSRRSVCQEVVPFWSPRWGSDPLCEDHKPQGDLTFEEALTEVMARLDAQSDVRIIPD